ncbi:MAG: TerB N-terminal domain-containing protein, partial [Oscillospiraceae bacterium]|nr:TerB N-terminal domain-containing protein [Oscillospiraceae bacterium]
ELLNNIGADNREDGLSKLMSFWKAFSIHAPAIDKHISKWIKEYYDYYDFSSNFEPESSFCDSDDLESWNKISSYDITKSRFYIDGNESLVKDCFKMVVRELKRRINFKDLLFSPVSFEREPFRDALFFNESNKTIQMKRLFITDSGKKFVGYILKKTEVCIRRQVKFKYKIKADLGEFDEDIEQAVRGYFAELNRVEVEVDLGNLERIRKEASGTLEKLVVPEPEDEPEMGETVKVFETREVSESNAENPFGETELKALALLLNDEKSIKQFADENGIMTEVLVDGINEKAFDLIGDSLIDDDFKVYDDYVNQMKEMLQI